MSTGFPPCFTSIFEPPLYSLDETTSLLRVPEAHINEDNKISFQLFLTMSLYLFVHPFSFWKAARRETMAMTPKSCRHSAFPTSLYVLSDLLSIPLCNFVSTLCAQLIPLCSPESYCTNQIEQTTVLYVSAMNTEGLKTSLLVRIIGPSIVQHLQAY
jgi:hypothetical protein